MNVHICEYFREENFREEVWHGKMKWKDSVINQKFCFKNLKKKKEFQNVQIQILIRT